MTTEKSNQEQEQEKKCPEIDCCSPQKFAEMMTKCCEGTDCDCPTMMKSGCCQPESK